MPPDGEHLRLWEMAGAAHFDTYLVFAAGKDDGRLAPAGFARLVKRAMQVMSAATDSPVNSGPQQHYIALAEASYEAPG